MNNVKILLIGKHSWITKAKEELSQFDEQLIETISDEDAAIQRLTHNSYDILVIQDSFRKKHPGLSCVKMAYAMTRPSIIVASSLLSYIKLRLMHRFSKFSRRFKLSRKMININFKFKGLSDKISLLSKDYHKYFNSINKEIKENTKTRYGIVS